MSVQRVTMSFQQIVEWVFPTGNRREVAVEEEEASELRINPRQLRQILKGRRLPRSRHAFRGFDSPPGRF